MKVRNISKDTVLSENLQEAKSFSDRLLGILKKLNIGCSILFKTRFGIHTFFMKDPIDVVILDNNLKVVKMATVKPNNLFFWNPKYFKVLEFSQGTINKTCTKPGDILILNQ